MAPANPFTGLVECRIDTQGLSGTYTLVVKYLGETTLPESIQYLPSTVASGEVEVELPKNFWKTIEFDATKEDKTTEEMTGLGLGQTGTVLLRVKTEKPKFIVLAITGPSKFDVEVVTFPSPSIVPIRKHEGTPEKVFTDTAIEALRVGAQDTAIIAAFGTAACIIGGPLAAVCGGGGAIVGFIEGTVRGVTSEILKAATEGWEDYDVIYIQIPAATAGDYYFKIHNPWSLDLRDLKLHPWSSNRITILSADIADLLDISEVSGDEILISGGEVVRELKGVTDRKTKRIRYLGKEQKLLTVKVTGPNKIEGTVTPFDINWNPEPTMVNVNNYFRTDEMVRTAILGVVQASIEKGANKIIGSAFKAFGTPFISELKNVWNGYPERVVNFGLEIAKKETSKKISELVTEQFRNPDERERIQIEIVRNSVNTLSEKVTEEVINDDTEKFLNELKEVDKPAFNKLKNEPGKFAEDYIEEEKITNPVVKNKINGITQELSDSAKYIDSTAFFDDVKDFADSVAENMQRTYNRAEYIAYFKVDEMHNSVDVTVNEPGTHRGFVGSGEYTITVSLNEQKDIFSKTLEDYDFNFASKVSII